MSISSEITRIKNNIASAYSSVGAKGGTLPETKNSANLPSAINSIPTSSTPSWVNKTWNGGNIYVGDGITINNFVSDAPTRITGYLTGFLQASAGGFWNNLYLYPYVDYEGSASAEMSSGFYTEFDCNSFASGTLFIDFSLATNGNLNMGASAEGSYFWEAESDFGNLQDFNYDEIYFTVLSIQQYHS